MRALHLHPPSTLTLSTTTSIPSPSPTQYLIRVHATSITANELTWAETLRRPSPIPGHDVCGTIVSTPNGISPRFHNGDEVFALTSFSRDGAAAEYVVAEDQELAPKPRNLTSSASAAVPLSVLTAWQALFVHAGLDQMEGEDVSVLVLGAAGGVGVMAVQLARRHCVRRLVGTCSGRNREFVNGLGADEVVDYTKGERVEGKFDIVLDCVGGSAQDECWGNVADGGILVSVATPLPEERKREWPKVRSVFFVVEPHGEQLGILRGLFEKEMLRAFVDQMFPLDEGQAAFDLLAKGHTRGKIILNL